MIQRSDHGPATYLVTAADLKPVHRGNQVVKFADDTYVIVPADNSETCATEVSHVNDWAERNNLRPNCAKTKETVFRAKSKQSRADNSAAVRLH